MPLTLSPSPPRGSVFAGPWMYHYDLSRHWPYEECLIWDGKRWLPLISPEAQPLIEELRP